MPKNSDIFALDLGTSKFCIAALRFDRRTQTPSLETISVKAQGMRRGMLAEPAKAAEGLNLLLESSERKLGCDITRVSVGIAGYHLSGRQVRTAIDLSGNEVSSRHLEQIQSNAVANFQVDGKEILHAIPVSFRVDDRPATPNPKGLSGERLNGSFFIIEGDRAYLKDVVSLCNQCGLEVAQLVAEPYASSLATLSQDDRELGVGVCDIGGGTTDGMVYLDGKAFASFTVNIAGHMMTNDLALGLNLPTEQAERVKTALGLAGDAFAQLTVEDVRGRQIAIDADTVRRILQPRIEELIKHVRNEIRPFIGSLGLGLVLTGGGSEVAGICELFERHLGIPVSKVSPRLRPASSCESSDASQAYKSHPSKLATALGILQLTLDSRINSMTPANRRKSSRYVTKLYDWLKEFS